MCREMREELKVRPKTALRVRRSEGETDQEEGRKKTEQWAPRAEEPKEPLPAEGKTRNSGLQKSVHTRQR